MKIGSRSSCLAAVPVCCFLLMAATSAQAVSIGQVDDFEDGTTQGWGEGGPSPNPPMNIATGGPAGVGDNYLENVSSGSIGVAGGRLVMFNTAQWTGDYTAAGVTKLTADVNNLGSTPLELRLALDGAGGRFSTTTSVALTAGSGWTSVSFDITSGDLTAVGGSDASATLADVSQLRILSSTSPSFQGDALDAVLGVDNLRAVPEPVSGGALLTGLTIAACARRTRRR